MLMPLYGIFRRFLTLLQQRAMCWALAATWLLVGGLNTPLAQAQDAGEHRLALVIGNANYRNAPLTNPVNDARLMEAVLKQAGFQVIKAENASLRETRRLVRDFGDRLKQRGGVGLFYFAGHGVQVKGENYLVSIDSDIRNEDEVAEDALNAQLVLEKMQSAGNRVNLVILDACRNNPFAVRSRASGMGLATMSAPSGSMVAYSTSPGSVASDGNGQNGLYTQHLAKVISNPGLPVEEVFKQVRTLVRRDSNNQQTPWENTALEGQFYFQPSQLAAIAPALVTGAPRVENSDATKLELSLWETVKNSGSVDELRSYLARYPQGVFAQVAHSRVASLQAFVKPMANSTVITPSVAASQAGTAVVSGTAAKPVAAASTVALASQSAKPSAAADAKPSLPAAMLDSKGKPFPDGEYVAGTTKFTGRFASDPKSRTWSGVGKVAWDNGDVFEGTLVTGKRQGHGTFIWGDGKYTGDWVDDRAVGKGILDFKNGNHYEGEVIDSVPNGAGFMKYASGDTYKGAFTNGKAHGLGAYVWRSGQTYEGAWQMDVAQGMGQMHFANGNQYQGEVVGGLPHGAGAMKYAEGDTYKGSFQQGVPDGHGTYEWKGGDKYTGHWKAGLKNGEGVFVWASGDRWEGVYQSDQQTASGKLIRRNP
jgi:hypothetical protein